MGRGCHAATIYPAYYILPWVERWAPLWLGGHVVGFGSFFLYMVVTDADLMKSDHRLEAESQTSPLQESIRKFKLARLEAKMLREREEAATIPSQPASPR